MPMRPDHHGYSAVPQAQPRLKSWRGCQLGWITDLLPFPAPSIPRLSLLLHPSSFNHCRLQSYSFLQLDLGKRFKLPAEMTTSRKSWRDHVQLVPTISKVGGDASHASHRAVAPRYRADTGLDVVSVSVLVLQNRSCLGLHHWSGYQRRGPRGMSPNSRTKISGPGLGLELHSS